MYRMGMGDTTATRDSYWQGFSNDSHANEHLFVWRSIRSAVFRSSAFNCWRNRECLHLYFCGRVGGSRILAF